MFISPEKYGSALLILSTSFENAGEFWDFTCEKYTWVDQDAAIAAYQDPLGTNDALHAVHQANPQLREQAVKWIAEKLDFVVELIYDKIQLDLNAEFPAELRIKIEDAVSHIKDDLYLSYGQTWKYDHVFHARGHKENACVWLYAATQESLEFAKRILKDETGAKEF